MIIKAIWRSIVFITISGGIFMASFGVRIQKAFYEKTEIIVAEYEE
ncbi:MAG: hypothetical protein LBU35_01285 [Holosporales bacterium]|jgi:hypothetical protein|nr:hypothetical protein [Holosporales bacterium]